MARTLKRWLDKDLDLIFSVLPTDANAEKLGRIMDRTPGSIKLAWRYSANTKKRNDKLGQRGKWGERCRKAKVRNGWVC